MIRHGVAGALLIALAIGCGSFGAASDPPPPIVAIAANDAGNDAAIGTGTVDGGDGAGLTDSGLSSDPTVAACGPAIIDHFNRDSPVVLSPWTSAIGDGKINLDGYTLSVETPTNTDQATLSTGRFIAPENVDCKFTFKPHTPFTSTGFLPIDIVTLALHYKDGRTTLYRASFTNGKLGVRTDKFDARGVCVQCPAQRVEVETGSVKKDELSLIHVFFSNDLMTMAAGLDPPLSLDLVDIDEPESVELLFGIWSFSPYAQQATFDELVCNVSC